MKKILYPILFLVLSLMPIFAFAAVSVNYLSATITTSQRAIYIWNDNDLNTLTAYAEVGTYVFSGSAGSYTVVEGNNNGSGSQPICSSFSDCNYYYGNVVEHFTLVAPPPPPPPDITAGGPSVSDLTGSIATAYNNLLQVVSPYANFAIGVILVLLVFGFATDLFKKRTPKTGYFSSTKNGLSYDKDQALGKMTYDIQTKGKWTK